MVFKQNEGYHLKRLLFFNAYFLVLLEGEVFFILVFFVILQLLYYNFTKKKNKTTNFNYINNPYN